MLQDGRLDSPARGSALRTVTGLHVMSIMSNQEKLGALSYLMTGLAAYRGLSVSIQYYLEMKKTWLYAFLKGESRP